MALNETGQWLTPLTGRNPDCFTANDILSDARVNCSIARPSQNSNCFRTSICGKRTERALTGEKPFPYATCNSFCPECDRGNDELCSNQSACECTHLKTFPPMYKEQPVLISTAELYRDQGRRAPLRRKSTKPKLQYELPFSHKTAPSRDWAVPGLKSSKPVSPSLKIRRVVILLAEF